MADNNEIHLFDDAISGKEAKKHDSEVKKHEYEVIPGGEEKTADNATSGAIQEIGASSDAISNSGGKFPIIDQDISHSTNPVENIKLRRKCIKNIIIIGITGFCTHIVTEVTASLSSSLSPNVVRAMALKAYCVIFGCYLAPLVIKIITARYCLVLGPLVSACFMASFLNPQFVLLLSVSSVYGLIVGVFYVAALFHLMDCTFTYASLSTMSMQKASSFSNAYLWAMFSLSGATGNLFVSLHLTHYKNSTMPEEEFFDMCGNNFCPDYVTNSSVIKPPTKESLDVLIYILIVLAVIGATIGLIFLENLTEHKGITKDKDTSVIWHQLGSVLKLFCDVRLLLLVPIIITHGMIQMYPDVDYTQGYVTCMLGVQNIGFMMVCTTGSSTLGTFVSGSMGSFVRPLYIIVGAFAVLAAIFTTLLLWNMTFETKEFVYLMPAAIGFCDGVTRTQLSAYVVVLLKERSDAASSAYFMLNILGHSLIFSWDLHLCMEVKLGLMLALVVISSAAFTVLDVRQQIMIGESIPVQESHEEMEVGQKNDVGLEALPIQESCVGKSYGAAEASDVQ